MLVPPRQGPPGELVEELGSVDDHESRPDPEAVVRHVLEGLPEVGVTHGPGPLGPGVILGLAGGASTGTAGLMGALNKADESGALQTGRAARRIFEVRLVGLDKSPVSCRDGVRLHPSAAAPQIAAPDLVVVPG